MIFTVAITALLSIVNIVLNFMPSFNFSIPIDTFDYILKSLDNFKSLLPANTIIQILSIEIGYRTFMWSSGFLRYTFKKIWSIIS